MTDAIFSEAVLRAEGLPSRFLEDVAALWRPLSERIRAEWAKRGGALVVGLCGPQGSGKSTGAMALQKLLMAAGLRCAVLSLDDLYLGHAARADLAATVHPLLATRGPPGTHDVELGVKVLDRLAAPGVTRLPRFDKGWDDRLAPSEWPPFDGPAQVVIFEGWCVGARPQPPVALVQPINALETERDPDGVWRRYINDALAERYPALFGRIDLLVQLRPPSFEVVVGWRVQQEQRLRAKLGAGQGRAMTDAEVARFVQHYERLSRHIDTEMPSRADVVIQLDAARRMVAAVGLTNVG